MTVHLDQGAPVSYDIALIYWGLGNKEKALAMLEDAYYELGSGIIDLNIEPRWDNLRSDPRFIALLKKMSFEK